MLRRIAVVALVVTACSAPTADITGGTDLPTITVEEFTSHLSALDRPAVVNVWASWCLPCRSEAPLLAEASKTYGDRVEFIGVDVQDNRPDARQFLAEFGLDFDHFFDRDRAIPNHYGGIGTPITIFFGPQGELFALHDGVLDERTLALNIDEILQLGA
jgi:cytochrome c biogenesis protein CcmG/thiol:disulfide interchange protein DsbE